MLVRRQEARANSDTLHGVEELRYAGCIDELTDELTDGRWQMQLARAAGKVRKSKKKWRGR